MTLIYYLLVFPPHLSGDVLAILPSLLFGDLDTGGLRLRMTNLLRDHPALLYGFLLAELHRLLDLDWEADLPII